MILVSLSSLFYYTLVCVSCGVTIGLDGNRLYWIEKRLQIEDGL